MSEFDVDAANANAATAVATMSDSASTMDKISSFRNGVATIVSSIRGDDFDTKLTVIDAITNSVAIDDNLGKTINLQNFVIQRITMENEQTGRPEEVPRMILIDADGTAYHAISKGIFSAIENFVGILGEPAKWAKPVVVHAVKLPAKRGKVLTLKTGKSK